MAPTRPSALGLTLVGDIVALASIRLAILLALATPWRVVDERTHGGLPPHVVALHELRSVAGPYGVPAVAVLLLVLTAWTWRHSRRDALVLLLVAVGGSMTVQLLNPVWLPGLEGIGPLSGHIGAASAVCLGWIVVAPRRSLRSAAWLAAATMGTMVAAMVLAGWHTVPEVVASVGVCAGWAIGASGLAEKPGSVDESGSVEESGSAEEFGSAEEPRSPAARVPGSEADPSRGEVVGHGGRLLHRPTAPVIASRAAARPTRAGRTRSDGDGVAPHLSPPVADSTALVTRIPELVSADGVAVDPADVPSMGTPGPGPGAVVMAVIGFATLVATTATLFADPEVVDLSDRAALAASLTAAFAVVLLSVGAVLAVRGLVGSHARCGAARTLDSAVG